MLVFLDVADVPHGARGRGAGVYHQADYHAFWTSQNQIPKFTRIIFTILTFVITRIIINQLL